MYADHTMLSSNSTGWTELSGYYFTTNTCIYQLHVYLCFAAEEQKQMGKALNGQDHDVKEWREWRGYVHQEDNRCSRALHLGRLIHRVRWCTVAGFQCSKYCTVGWPDRLKWRTSATLLTMTPVNQS